MLQDESWTRGFRFLYGRDAGVEERSDAGEVIRWTVKGEHIQRSRARIDTRKWLIGMRAPKKYGDKVETTIRQIRRTKPSRT